MTTELAPTPEDLARIAQRRENEQKVADIRDYLDPGIARYVEILILNGVETYESCQGGADPSRPNRGHAYPEPTVRFHGGQGAGWWALQVCLDYGLPVQSLSRIWTVQDREPHGPTWQLVFTEADAVTQPSPDRSPLARPPVIEQPDDTHDPEEDA